MKPIKIETALTTFDVKEAVLADLESSTKLTIADKESEGVVRKYRQQAKSLQVQIEKRRLQLNREYKDRTDKAAETLTTRINPVYDDLDAKIKVVEAEREKKRLEKEAAEKAEQERLEKIEAERVAKIESALAEVTTAAKAGQEYNLPASEIKLLHHALNNLEIAEDVFQERYFEAMEIWKKGLEDTHTALIAREKFEQEQSAQEAEKKRLADERAKFEAEQKAVADAKAKEAVERFLCDWDDAICYDAVWIKKKEAEREAAEKARQEAEQINRDREVLEKEKAEILAEKQAEEDRKRAEAERIAEVEKHFVSIPRVVQERVNSPEQLHEYYEVLAELDIDENLFRERLPEFKKFLEEKKAEIIDNLYGMAIKENAEFDKARKEKQKADKARVKLIDFDKALLMNLMKQIKTPDFNPSALQTDAGKKAFQSFAENFDSLIDTLKTDIEGLS